MGSRATMMNRMMAIVLVRTFAIILPIAGCAIGDGGQAFFCVQIGIGQGLS